MLFRSALVEETYNTNIKIERALVEKSKMQYLYAQGDSYVFMNNEIEEAMLKLEEWLSHPNELGCRPSNIEYTNSFTDEDGIKCIIFKYKKTVLGKWLLGIVSESGTFSEMQKYNKSTEIEDARKILEMLKNYWRERLKNMQ